MTFQHQSISGWTGHSCSVGLMRAGEDRHISGKDVEDRSTFTPIISLPFLQNDEYMVRFTGGKIVITTSRGGKDVVELNLEGTAPNTITLPVTGLNKNIVELDHLGGVTSIAPPPAWKDSEGAIETIVHFERELAGTTLTTLQAFSSQKETGKSAHKCTIGYKSERNGGGRSTFTPVLTLPYLEGDAYEVKFTGGKIVVTTKGNRKSVVELNLADLAPTTITQIQGEPDSGANRRSTTVPKSDSKSAGGTP